MDAVLRAPVKLQSGLRAAYGTNGSNRNALRSASRNQVTCKSAVVAPACSVLHTESLFGSRQLLSGCKYEGLRKEAASGSGALKREKRRLSRQLWWQLAQGPARSPGVLQIVRAGLSGVPEGNLGLYDPSYDKDACGVGFVADLSAKPSRQTVSPRQLLIHSLLLHSQNCNRLERNNNTALSFFVQYHERSQPVVAWLSFSWRILSPRTSEILLRSARRRFNPPLCGSSRHILLGNIPACSSFFASQTQVCSNYSIRSLLSRVEIF